jgi:hypothetical protein
MAKKVTEWSGPSVETGKTDAPCHSRCGTIKIPPCSKALVAEHRLTFLLPFIGNAWLHFHISEKLLTGTQKIMIVYQFNSLFL